MEASACICYSKQVESSFSPLSTTGRGKGNLDIFQMSDLYRKDNCEIAGLDTRDMIVLDKTLISQSIGLHAVLDCLTGGKHILLPGTILRPTKWAVLISLTMFHNYNLYGTRNGGSAHILVMRLRRRHTWSFWLFTRCIKISFSLHAACWLSVWKKSLKKSRQIEAEIWIDHLWEGLLDVLFEWAFLALLLKCHCVFKRGLKIASD